MVALEAVFAQNRQKYSKSRLKEVTTENPPTFSFANSTENRCLSTASLLVEANGQKGELIVHTLDHGQSPIVVSVETLRALGAILDFSSDLAVFRNLDARKVVPFARRKSGHQLLPLTEDWIGTAHLAATAVPSLTSFIQHQGQLLPDSDPDEKRKDEEDKSEKCQFNFLPADHSTGVESCVHGSGESVSGDAWIGTLANSEPLQSAEAEQLNLMDESAAILAQLLVPLPFVPALDLMDRMSKPDLILHLRAYGKEPPVGWTKLELRQAQRAGGAGQDLHLPKTEGEDRDAEGSGGVEQDERKESHPDPVRDFGAGDGRHPERDNGDHPEASHARDHRGRRRGRHAPILGCGARLRRMGKTDGQGGGHLLGQEESGGTLIHALDGAGPEPYRLGGRGQPQQD